MVVLFPCCLNGLPTGGDPGAEEGMGYMRLPRFVVLGKLLLSLLDEEVGRFVVCFIVFGSVNVDVVGRVKMIVNTKRRANPLSPLSTLSTPQHVLNNIDILITFLFSDVVFMPIFTVVIDNSPGGSVFAALGWT